MKDNFYIELTSYKFKESNHHRNKPKLQQKFDLVHIK